MITARLDCPEVPRHVVYRGRLVDELADPDWRVALVTGGPGSGKTVAVAQWFESLVGVARAWLTLGKEDDTPARFWATLILGLSRAVPDAFVGSKELAADPPIGTGPMLEQILIELSDLEKQLVLVVDDVHLLRDSQIWQGLKALVERLPRHVRLVLTSRVDPPIPIALWSTHSWFMQIRQADLAFTLPETMQFFGAIDENRLTSDDIGILWQHTEGWAAGLHLAAFQIRRRTDASDAAREFSGHHRLVIDLLATEILDVQSPEIADFMLRTCVLDVLDADTCNALSDRTDSDQILRSLEAQMPFIDTLDSKRELYRYHPLMSDVLRSLLKTRRPGAPELLAQIAADVVEQRGDIVSSISYFIAAGDTDRAVSLAFHAVSDFDRDAAGDINVEQWVDNLRPHSASAPIDSILAYAISLSIADRTDECLVWLELATLRIASDPQTYVREAAFVDAFRLTVFAVMSGTGDGVESGRRVMAMVESGAYFGYPCNRVRPNLVRAYLLTDQPDEAGRVVAEGPMGDEVAQLVLGPAVKARVALRMGELTKAEDLTTRAFAAARSLGMENGLGAIDAYLAQVGVLTERNRLGEADASVRLLKAICDSHPEALVYQVLARVDQTRLAAARDEPEGVFALIDEMRALIAGRQRPVLERLIDVVAARRHIEAGDLSNAEELISGLPSDWPQVVLLSARLDLAHDRPHDAIERLSHQDFGGGRDRLACELLRTKASVAANDQMVETYISSAVELAAPEGFARLVLEEGPVVTRLVRAAAEGLGTRAGSQLAASLGAPPRLRTIREAAIVLSERERAVMRFLPTQLTNQEIAKECLMSVNTVKTHVKNVYAKLGVSSRSFAVERARLMDIL